CTADTAAPSPSTVAPGVRVNSLVSASYDQRARSRAVGLSARVSDVAPHEPSVTVQSADPDPSRVVATPSAVEAVAAFPLPDPSISTLAREAPSPPRTASEPERA